MQAIAARNPRSNNLSWLGALPVALIVGLSLAACSSSVPTNATTSTNGTEPACRVNSCTSLAKNCGIVADGCGGELRCGTCAGANNDCINNMCERSCQSNSECPGTACVNGSCTDKCSTAADCQSGQTCTNGSCMATAAQSCHYDSDCRSTERCENSACVSTVTNSNQACSVSSQCLPGETCTNGLCTNNGGTQACRTNTDCPINESCTNGYCYQANGNYGSCRVNTDCPIGQSCSYGVCSGYNNGGYNNSGVRAQCITRGVSLPLPFGDVSISTENDYYDAQNPNGIRVDSCTCGTGVMHLSDSSGNRDVGCSQCIKDGDNRTCYN